MLPQLLEQVPAQEPLLTVTGDGAYDTQPVHAAVMQRNAMPCHAMPCHVMSCHVNHYPEKECPDAQRRYLCASQCGHRRMQALWAQAMEKLERLPPTEPGGDQDALHQAAGRKGDVTHVRAASQ